MKISFHVIRTSSGNDTYFERLSDTMKRRQIETEVHFYHKIFQYFPWMLKIMNTDSDADIIHSNIEYAWVFKQKSKQLWASLFHNVLDPSYRRYVSPFQRIYHLFIVEPNIKKSLKVADKLFAISHFTKKSFTRTYGQYPMTVSYPSLNTDAFKPSRVDSRDSRFKILFVGNLTVRKGADLLPKIMENLNESYVLYFTAGLRSRIPESFNRDNMVPLGKLTEVELIRWLNICDTLIFPSRLEGFGYAVAEAMACGKPVVASDDSSIGELIKHKENGYLFPPDDYIRAARFIRLLKHSPNLRKTIGMKNRRKAVRLYSRTSISISRSEFLQS